MNKLETISVDLESLPISEKKGLSKLREFKEKLLENSSQNIQKIPDLSLQQLKIELTKDYKTVNIRLNFNMEEILELIKKIRFNLSEPFYKYNLRTMESNSEIIRHLILEEWERKKQFLLNYSKPKNESEI